MPKALDLEGMQFGSLTIIERLDGRSNRGRVLWRCSCACGRSTCAKVIIVDSSALSGGKMNSCRMHQFDQAVPYATRQYFTSMRSRAKQRGYAFELTLDEFRAIIQQPCHYCGTIDIRSSKSVYGHFTPLRNGIDRSDNTQGYTLSNSVPCCAKCNRAKLTMTAQEYLEHCERVVNYNKKGNGDAQSV